MIDLCYLVRRVYGLSYVSSLSFVFLINVLPFFHGAPIARIPWLSLLEDRSFLSSIQHYQNLLEREVPVIYYSETVGRPIQSLANLQHLSSYKYLLENHGANVVTLSSSNAFSHDVLDTSLASYLHSFQFNDTAFPTVDGSSILFDTLPANETYYLFGHNYDGIWKEITSQYHIPGCDRVCDEAGAKTIGLGGLYSGVAFHFHGNGFVEVIHGAKEWYFFPPAMKHLVNRISNYQNMTTLQWKSCIYPLLVNTASSSSLACNMTIATEEMITMEELALSREHFFEGIIYPGDLLYFPKEWMHATLNLGKYNVFISTFIDPQLVKVEE